MDSERTVYGDLPGDSNGDEEAEDALKVEGKEADSGTLTITLPLADISLSWPSSVKFEDESEVSGRVLVEGSATQTKPRHPTSSGPNTTQIKDNLDWGQTRNQTKHNIDIEERFQDAPRPHLRRATLGRAVGHLLPIKRVKSKLSRSSSRVSRDTNDTKSPQLYQSLSGKQTRVLRLFDGGWNDRLVGKIETINLNDPPSFEALSYTWADETGDKVLSESILLGPEAEVFPITKNCCAALRRVRDQNRSHQAVIRSNGKLLWVDAICIHQSDIEERTHQVALMRDIYLGASQVIVYIGEATKNSDLAMWKMDDTARNVPLHSLSKEVQQAITDLFQRPYFNRVWILQEMILPHCITILCGASALCSSSQKQQADHISRFAKMTGVPSWIRYCQADIMPVKAKRFFDILVDTLSSRSTDPRDKIFGLCGMLLDAEETGLLPDYSLSTTQVYIGLAAYLINTVIDQGNDLAPLLRLTGLLSQGSPVYSEAASLPTWVPNWTVRPRHTDLDTLIRTGKVDGMLIQGVARRGTRHAKKHCDGSHPVRYGRQTGVLLIEALQLISPIFWDGWSAHGTEGMCCHLAMDKSVLVEGSRWTARLSLPGLFTLKPTNGFLEVGLYYFPQFELPVILRKVLVDWNSEEDTPRWQYHLVAVGELWFVTSDKPLLVRISEPGQSTYMQSSMHLDERLWKPLVDILCRDSRTEGRCEEWISVS